MIDTAIGGMKTRFTNRGKNPGIVILASSKRSEKSFLEEHMKRKAESEKENTLIVDEAVWDIKPKGTYSDKHFYVAVGNRFLTSDVIREENPDLDAYRDRGYRILEVPVDLRANFLDDIDRALCDFAGISSSELSTYISGVRLAECKHKEILNPFVKDIIEVGNAPDDKTQYWDYFDIERVPKALMNKPLYIHLDMSVSGDKTGIGGVWVIGKKPSVEGEPASKDLFYQAAFCVSVKAPKGHQVSFEKNRQFIRWLKEKGFKVKGISCDTYQSYDLLQQLKSENFNTSVISVDRVNSDHVCVPYQNFKSVIYEARLKLFAKCDLLTTEIVSLERNGNTGKVDHPDRGSKDASDALCGAIYNASLNAEQYAFDYGEDVENTLTVSSDLKSLTREQITVDFEDELRKVFRGLPDNSTNTSANAKKMDFGFGPAVSVEDEGFISQGIMVF